MRQIFLVPLVLAALELTLALSTIKYENKIGYGLVSPGVGDPPTTYHLLLETGGSNTWVGANAKNPFVKTKTSKETGKGVKAFSVWRKFSGQEWTDTITLSSGLVVSQQGIGVASSSTGVPTGVDGVLGLGPVGLSEGTVDGIKTVPTITDNLFSQKTISENLVGIGRGTITFGGIDVPGTSGPVTYVKITETSPAGNYWGIDASFYYGNRDHDEDDTTVLAITAGIVDHGTTLLLLATDAFERFQKLTGGVLDKATGLLRITPDQYIALKTLKFRVGGTKYNILPNALIWPRAENKAIGGKQDEIYLAVNGTGTKSGVGLDFIVGYRILYDRLYTVLDTAKKQVGFATTPSTNHNEN